MLHQNRIF